MPKKKVIVAQNLKIGPRLPLKIMKRKKEDQVFFIATKLSRQFCDSLTFILEVPETGSLFRFGFVLFRLKPCRFDLNSANSAKWFYCVETVL